MTASRAVRVNLFALYCFLTLCVSISSLENIHDDLPTIAVIGAGIGGTTAVHYLKELFGKDVQIDVYEQYKVGGRLGIIEMDGKTYEAGGSVIHPRNQYMVNFTELLGLKKREDGPYERIGLWNGTEMLFEGSRLPSWTLVKLAWRYGFDVIKINSWVEMMLQDFDRIYTHQEAGFAFTTVEDLILSMSEHMLNLSQTTISDALEKASIGDRFVDEFVMAGLRMNYGQSNDVHGLVGSISMAGTQSGLWCVHGGNQQVPEKLLEKANVKVTRAKVTKVVLDKDNGPLRYSIEYLLPDEQNTYKHSEMQEVEYDIVVIAAPFSKDRDNIHIEGVPGSLEHLQLKYHRTVATFAQGMPNVHKYDYINLYEHTDVLLTTNPSLYFNSFARQDTVDYKHVRDDWYADNDTDRWVWKVFSQEKLTPEELDELFKTRKNVQQIVWSAAYPEYGATANLKIPFILNEQLYYANGIEQAASAMELSAIGGRNVAILAYNHWNHLYDNIDVQVGTTGEGTDGVKSEL